MAVWSLAALLCLLGGGVMAAPAEQSPESGEQRSEAKPRIQFETLEHDFGKAPAGDDLDTTFAFKNVGDAPLIIQKVKGG
jgi:hypothetical protein